MIKNLINSIKKADTTDHYQMMIVLAVLQMPVFFPGFLYSLIAKIYMGVIAVLALTNVTLFFIKYYKEKKQSR
ncbi:hypothetical protein OAT00_01685 [Pelagibacteraceae bacterium]|nr:hypothetical protein [Pelagibacteraceae bacterium]